MLLLLLIVVFLQLLAVFMQLDARSLLMRYIDLSRTRNIQLTFDALLVGLQIPVDPSSDVTIKCLILKHV